MQEKDEEITFEVSGQVFVEKKSLLCKYPESLLAQLFGPQLSSLPLNENAQPFLERGPKSFKLLMDYLKSDDKVMPANEHLKNLLTKELEFFGLGDVTFNPQDEVKASSKKELKQPEMTDPGKPLEPVAADKIFEKFDDWKYQGVKCTKTNHEGVKFVYI